MREFFVEKRNENTKLSKFITQKFPNLKYSIFKKALRNKDIKINGKSVSNDIVLNYKDNLKLYIADNFLFDLPVKLEKVYADDNIFVFFKPQGILCNHNDNLISSENGQIQNQDLEPTFDDLVKKEFKSAKLCHRLDRNTSGLLIFAKNNDSYKEILDGFKNYSIIKEYTAVVSNCNFNSNHELLEKYILKDPLSGFSKIYDTPVKNSKKILTEYNVISQNKVENIAVLKIKIHTGKTHQIRAQMASISHPILGDSKYGKNEINKKFKLYKQQLFATKYSFNFKKDSKLYYLNNITIELDKSFYEKK
ncbi:MAG: RluA family pseudouridine synthase [Clostridia bacterium]